jgi:hypothetical protein
MEFQAYLLQNYTVPPPFIFFFIIRRVGGGVQTGSTRHVGHWMAYCTCPGWLWWWRTWWNEDWQGKPKYSEKTYLSATLSTTNPTWPDPGSNPGHRGGKPATNRLSYGAASRLSEVPFLFLTLFTRSKENTQIFYLSYYYFFCTKRIKRMCVGRSCLSILKLRIRNCWMNLDEIWHWGSTLQGFERINCHKMDS